MQSLVDLGIGSLLDVGKTIAERIWPDPIERAKEVRKLEELHQKGNLEELRFHVELMLGQMRVNEQQAKHKSIFVAGARPAAIWAGVFSLMWSGFVHPILTWVWAFSEISGDPPPLIESMVLGNIVAALLGVAGMRSYDGLKGNKTNSIKGAK